jgi:hypothetical protein
MTRRPILAALVVLGCSQTLPPVSIQSVSPQDMVASQPTQVSVQVDAELAFQVDYGQGALTPDSEMQVFIGPQPLGSGTYPPQGLVEGTLPTVIPKGTYNVTVKMGDGRTAVLPNAFSVDGGSWPFGYGIETIADQHSGVPFSVTVHAFGPGPRDPNFNGNVLLRILGDGNVTPTVSDAFSGGVLTQNVTVTGTGEFMLQASDINGGNGQSAPFSVTP